MNSDNSPHVTVCMPAFNAAKTISRAIESILAQDYPNYDILVSDNFSSDDTVKIVESYQERGVRCFLNPDKRTWNASENFNHILSLAGGPLIALYHADDLYTPSMLRIQVEFLQKNCQASAVFTMSQIIDEKDQPIRMSNLTLPKEYQGQYLFCFPDLLNAILKYGPITVVPTMMTRKSVLEKVGNFNWKQFCDAADIDLYLRMTQIGPIGIIDELLHKYRVFSTQIMRLITQKSTLNNDNNLI